MIEVQNQAVLGVKRFSLYLKKIKFYKFCMKNVNFHHNFSYNSDTLRQAKDECLQDLKIILCQIFWYIPKRGVTYRSWIMPKTVEQAFQKSTILLTNI